MSTPSGSKGERRGEVKERVSRGKEAIITLPPVYIRNSREGYCMNGVGQKSMYEEMGEPVMLAMAMSSYSKSSRGE